MRVRGEPRAEAIVKFASKGRAREKEIAGLGGETRPGTTEPAAPPPRRL